MRILVLSINYWPEETGIAPVVTSRSEYLASRGHEVTVCTTFPYYPQWKVDELYHGKFWQRETRKGVDILRSWSWIPSRLNALKRILFEASFLAANLVRAFSARKPDLLLVVSPPLGLGITANLLSKIWGIPYIFDVMDLQPDAAVELGMLRSGTLLRSLYWLEKSAYENARLVSTLTEGMRRRIISKSIPENKVALFALSADPELFLVRRGTDGMAFRRHHGLDGKFVVTHSGNMGVKQGLNVILDAAELSRNMRDVVYLLVGDGATRHDLEARAKIQNLTNVKFLPVLTRKQFLEMLAASDVGLITQQRSVADIVFPSKTATLMTVGCPLVASVNPNSEVARAVRESGSGVVVSPEDPDSLLTAITNLRDNPNQLAEMSSSGRNYAHEHWDEQTTLSRMESVFLGQLSDQNVDSNWKDIKASSSNAA
jgi:colanic acid biosynthesis glycosyl transferase WcaI